MGTTRRKKGVGLALTAASLVLALGAAPMAGFGADHLDAPNLTSPKMRPDADINDVYVFEGANASQTAIAVTTHPGAGAIAPFAYATDVTYAIRIDRSGDALADTQYALRFGKANQQGRQWYTVRRSDSKGTKVVAQGVTGKTLGVAGGGTSLDNTLRCGQLTDTEWVLADIRGHQAHGGFGQGSAHLWAEDGTLLGTASQTARLIVRDG